jgi:MFS family permease
MESPNGRHSNETQAAGPQAPLTPSAPSSPAGTTEGSPYFEPLAPQEAKPGPLREIIEPFIDLVHAPRALWGINLAYALEGLAYFGILTYLTIHFSDFVFRGVEHADIWSHRMVGVLTAGIAFSMAVLGFVPDKLGVRRALIAAFCLLLVGRIVMSAAPTLLGLRPAGLWSPLHMVTMGGILLVLVGYGMYQPAAYSAVRQFTNPKTASMGYAMLYALMNAGSSMTMGSFLLRDDKFLGLGITGTFWVYSGVTLVSLLITVFVLSNKTVERTIARAKAESATIKAAIKEAQDAQTGASKPDGSEKASVADEDLSDPQHSARGLVAEPPPGRLTRVPITAWISLAMILAGVMLRVPQPWKYLVSACLLAAPIVIALLPRHWRRPTLHWIATHPLADTKFFCFIFALIPVQTLFTYNWLVLPQYISRSYTGWVGEYFEIASNANPVLIFFSVPIITALTYKRKVYNMILAGTLVMAASAFILALGANLWTLVAYIILMTIGEAMWSARFLQYATEIAPEGKAGLYQGVAQLPWFLTKFLVPLLYSGWMMERYCPAAGAMNTKMMWLIFGCIAMISPLFLLLARGWLGKDFKTKAA